jgi:hypothetical protein
MGDSIPVPAATANANQTTVPDDDRVCHLHYEVRSLADDSPLASYPYKVTVDGKEMEGETDGSGVFRVDTIAASDYLVQFGETRMWLNAFGRDEAQRVVILSASGESPADGASPAAGS